MKKIFLILTSLVLAAAMLGSCTGNATSGDSDTTGTVDAADTTVSAELTLNTQASADTRENADRDTVTDTDKTTDKVSGTGSNTDTVGSKPTVSDTDKGTDKETSADTYVPKPSDRPDQIIGSESAETFAPEVSELWPTERIVDIVGEGVPGFTGECDSIELRLLSSNMINPGVEIIVHNASSADIEAYKSALLANDFLDGEGQYILIVDGGALCIAVADEQGNMVIDVNLIKNMGSIRYWPAEIIDETVGTELGIPEMAATSFELDLSVRDISGIEVRSAVIACYGSSEAAADAFRGGLVEQGYELTDGVYHKVTSEASISISVTDTSYYAPNSVMITVAVTDNLTISHRTPTNLKLVYNESEVRHTATKINKDYMLTVDNGVSVTAYFYKYDSASKKWSEYSASGADDFAATGVVLNNSLDVETKVFGFVVDSNMIIFTYDGEVEAYCGITAKKYVYEYQEDLTVYKLQHAESGLILEVGVVELDIATACVTSYTTDVTEFGRTTP